MTYYCLVTETAYETQIAVTWHKIEAKSTTDALRALVSKLDDLEPGEDLEEQVQTLLDVNTNKVVRPDGIYLDVCDTEWGRTMTIGPYKAEVALLYVDGEAKRSKERRR